MNIDSAAAWIKIKCILYLYLVFVFVFVVLFYVDSNMYFMDMDSVGVIPHKGNSLHSAVCQSQFDQKDITNSVVQGNN